MSLPLIVGIAALWLVNPAPRPPLCSAPACLSQQTTPEQAQAPTASPGQNSPPEQPQTESPPSASPTPESKTPEPPKEPASEQKQKSSAGSTKKTTSTWKTKHHKKHSVATPPPDGPKKVVVRHGSTADPEVQFTPGMSQGQAYYQKQTTQQLLSGTEANLKTASNRQLQPTEQDSVEEIKSLMEQSKLAIVMGDLQRAHTLAYKAQLLSNELVKH